MGIIRVAPTDSGYIYYCLESYAREDPLQQQQQPWWEQQQWLQGGEIGGVL